MGLDIRNFHDAVIMETILLLKEYFELTPLSQYSNKVLAEIH
jgi:hypothetical protein